MPFGIPTIHTEAVGESEIHSNKIALAHYLSIFSAMPDPIHDKINAIDLTQQKLRLRKEKGWLWCRRRRLNDLERVYKNFLYQIVVNPGKIIRPPSQAMDDLWHAHILYTKKYQADCIAICGRFIHHYPDEIKESS